MALPTDIDYQQTQVPETEQISFAETPRVQDGDIQFYGNETPYTMSGEEAVNESQRRNYALGDQDSPGTEAIYHSLISGSDDLMRNSIQSNLAIRDRAMKEERIRGYLAGLGPVSNDDGSVNKVETQIRNEIMKADIRATPQNVYEREYGRRTMMEATTTDFEWPRLSVEDPEASAKATEKGRDFITQKQIHADVLDKFQKKYEEQGLGSRVRQNAASFVPFVTWLNTTNVYDDSQSGFFMGDIKDNQNAYVWGAANPTEFRERLEAGATEMWSRNPAEAITWLTNMGTYSQTDKGIDNLFSFMDLAGGGFDVTDVAKLAVAGAAAAGVTVAAKKLTAKIASTTRNLAKVSGTTPFSKAAIANATGDSNRLALEGTIATIQSRAAAGAAPDSFRLIENEIPTTLNPDQFYDTSVAFNKEIVDRMINDEQGYVHNLLRSAIADPVFVDRMANAQALDDAIDEAAEGWNMTYSQLSDRVLASNYVPATGAEGSITNVNTLEFMLGTKKGTWFDTEEAAAAEISRLGLPGAKPINMGMKYGIVMRKDIATSSPLAQRQLAMGKNNQAPNDVVNVFLAGLRSSEDILDVNTLTDFKTAQSGVTLMRAVMQQELKRMGQLVTLTGKSSQRMDNFLQWQRTKRSRTDPTKVGRFSRTVSEFESEWLNRFKELPSEKEATAYRAYVNTTNTEWMLRNLAIYKDKALNGLERWSFNYRMDDTRGKTGQATAFHIEGKGVKEIPWGNKEDAGILVIGDTPGQRFDVGNAKNRSYFRMKSVSQSEFDKQFGKGYRVIQLSPEGQASLRQVEGFNQNNNLPRGAINFILVKDAKSQPLSLRQIPYQPGGHIQYPLGGSYIKQPGISKTKTARTPRSTYHGDRTLYQQDVHAEAEKIVPKLNQARVMLKGVEEGKVPKAALDTYLAKELPHTFNQFRRLFIGKNAEFDIDTPFYAVKSGENTFDAHKLADLPENPNLTKSSDSVYNLYKGVDLEYAMARDRPLLSIGNTGTEASPKYAFNPARMLDPMATMDRAAESAFRGRYMDDLKVKTAEKFVEQFHSVLKTPLDELRLNPSAHLLEPDWSDNLVGDKRALLSQAKNWQARAADFVNYRSDLDRDIGWLEQKLLDNTMGGKTPGPIGGWALSVAKDPAAFFRSLTFNLKMGLFSPVQFFKQLNTVAHITAFEPKYVMQASMATTLQRGMMMNKNKAIADAAAGHAAWLGFKGNDFRDMSEFLRRSGWWKVGRDTAYIDDVKNANVVQGKMGQFLDASQMFFRAGDRITRMTAYNAAAMAWRAKNPTARFTDAVGKQLIQRADLMTVNMTAASNAAVQKGYGGLITQFAGYQMRMAEQLIGKRITGAERARIWGTYSMLYGIPTAAGATLGVWPVAEAWRQYAADNGIDTNTNAMEQILNDGVISQVTEAITGSRFDVAGAYGPGGTPMLRNLLNGDKSALEIMSGASGSVFGDIYMAMDPFSRILGATLNKDDDSTFPVAWRDVVDLMKPISLVKQADRLYYAMTLGQYVTKTDGALDNVTPLEGTFAAVFGLNPERIVDVYTLMVSAKRDKEFAERHAKEAQKHWRRGWEYMKEGDDESGLIEFKRAKMNVRAGNLTTEESAAAMRKASSGRVPLLESIGKRYIEQSPAKREYWNTIMKRRQDELGTQNNGDE